MSTPCLLQSRYVCGKLNFFLFWGFHCKSRTLKRTVQFATKCYPAVIREEFLRVLKTLKRDESSQKRPDSFYISDQVRVR